MGWCVRGRGLRRFVDHVANQEIMAAGRPASVEVSLHRFVGLTQLLMSKPSVRVRTRAAKSGLFSLRRWGLDRSFQ